MGMIAFGLGGFVFAGLVFAMCVYSANFTTRP